MIKIPYLIQRLTPPNPSRMAIDKAFGGGMLGLFDDAWEVLYQAFSIDYMGAAEYEFGTLPRALRQVFDERDNYGGWPFALPAKSIRPGWWRESVLSSARRDQIAEAKKTNSKVPRSNPKKLTEALGIKPIEDHTVYIFAPEAEREAVEDVVRKLAEGGVETKRDHNFGYALDPDPRNQGRKDVCGWFDLDNRLFFFLDEKMWRATCALFGRPVSEG